MKNKFAPLVALTFSLISSIAFGQNMESGLWRERSKFRLNGLPFPSRERETCVPASEVKDVKNTILKGLEKNGCILITWSVEGDQVQAEITCKNDQFEANGTLAGQYTSTTYNLAGQAKGVYQGRTDTRAKFWLQGELISQCK